MPFLIPSNRKRLERKPYRAPRISNEEIEARTAQIASAWTYHQRSERKLLGALKRDRFFRIIDRTSNGQEESNLRNVSKTLTRQWSNQEVVTTGYLDPLMARLQKPYKRSSADARYRTDLFILRIFNRSQ